MEYISTTQLRENFGQLKDGLAAGESYTLTHHSQPIAQIEPYANQHQDFKYLKNKRTNPQQEEIKQNVIKLKELANRAAKLNIRIGHTPDELNRMYDEGVYE